MSEFQPRAIDRNVVGNLPSAFIGLGLGADVDNAFDDAVEGAWYDYGRACAVPSVASTDISALSVIESAPLPQNRAVMLAVRHLHSGDATPGVVYALPITRDSAFSRRRVQVTSTDPTVELTAKSGELAHVPGSLEEHVNDLLTQKGVPLAGGEIVESLEVRRVTTRFRVSSLINRGRAEKRFAVINRGNGALVSTGHATATEANRKAKEIGRNGEVDEQEQYDLDVIAVLTREGGLPFSSVNRARVAQRASLKVTVAQEKDPAKTKPLGWVFFGRLTGPEPSSAAATVVALPQPVEQDEHVLNAA